jgi:hypothetical protein
LMLLTCIRLPSPSLPKEIELLHLNYVCYNYSFTFEE